MKPTAAQKRLMESDEDTGKQTRNLRAMPSPQDALKYAARIVREYPELAKQAGINSITPEQTQIVMDGVNQLIDMLRWIDNRTDDFTFWEHFPDSFPMQTPPQDPNAEPWEMGGWGRIDEIVDQITQALGGNPPLSGNQ